MDWLGGMNAVLRHIEENLTEGIAYEGLSKIVGCSVYEFSRIFSFMAGMSVSEYIRRRRLSQAVYDIQKGGEKIIDVALKYQYESPTTFSRAFKEVHGVSPMSARKPGVELRIYPPISFILQIKGVGPLNFKIEKRGAFPVMGLTGYLAVEDGVDGLASLWNAGMVSMESTEGIKPFDDEGEPETLGRVSIIDDTKMKLKVGVQGRDDIMPLIHITAAIDYASVDGKVRASIGFALDEMKAALKSGEPNDIPDPKKMAVIPAADWAVFTFTGERNADNMAQAYTRILTEWFGGSGYRRREDMPHLERFAVDDKTKGKKQSWEIWIPVS
jgi:AraC family transcriptional regulator